MRAWLDVYHHLKADEIQTYYYDSQYAVFRVQRHFRGSRLAGARKESTDPFLDSHFGFVSPAAFSLACHIRRLFIIPKASPTGLLLKQFLNAPDSMNG